MKGLIIYSSITGNTKRMAEHIYDHLKEKYDLDIKKIEDDIDFSQYDYALIGGYIDRSMPDKKVLKLLEKIDMKKLGLFGTLGADPEDSYGLETLMNMRKLINKDKYIGCFLCRGKVDEKLIKNLQGMKEGIMPQKLKETMIEVSLKSRMATIEELDDAAKYFDLKLSEI